VFEAAGDQVKHVGVFGHTTVENLTREAASLGLDALQLHELTAHDFLSRLRDEYPGEIWSVIAVDDPRAAALAARARTTVASAIVLDTSIAGRTGGTGKTFDWQAVADAFGVEPFGIPVILAGGLNPANVAQAIKVLKPDVVDVSSGVESSPGIKDHNLMRAFAEAVLSASIV